MRGPAVKSIFFKEWYDLIYSPVAYTVIVVYLVITGAFFFFITPFFAMGQASLRVFFIIMPYILSFAIAALTMRTYSEEYRSGTMEVLGTLPISTIEILAGKFLAISSFVGIMLAFTLGYPLSIGIARIGSFDVGSIVGGYIGLLLLGATYTSIGVMASSLSKNPVSAFFLTFGVTIILSLLDLTLSVIPSGFIVVLIQNLSSSYHIRNMARGVLDTRDIIYFLAISFLTLFATWSFNKQEH